MAHHQGLRIRELNFSRRKIDVSKCPTRLMSFFNRHAQMHYQQKWGFTKERSLIIQYVISAYRELRMRYMQFGDVTVSNWPGKPCL